MRLIRLDKAYGEMIWYVPQSKKVEPKPKDLYNNKEIECSKSPNEQEEDLT
jgi:hypothetical protein